MADAAADYLRTLHTSDRARAAAWDAVYAADDADAQRRLKELPFSDDVRADLWDIRQGASVSGGSAPQAATAEQFMDPSQVPQGSALRRFVGNVAEQLNPITAAKGIYQAVSDPRATINNLIDAQAQQFSQAGQAFTEGRMSEALGHGMAGVLPVIGPAAAGAGEQIASGDVAGGLGTGLGLMAATVGPRAKTVAKETVRIGSEIAPKAAARVAGWAERGAAERVADVMSPKVGPNKTRFGNQAEKVAPAVARDLATDGAPLTREGFRTQIQGKLAEAEAGLDAAADARNATAPIETRTIIDALREKRRQLTAEAVQADRRYPQYEGSARVARAGDEFQASGAVGTADVSPHQRGYRTLEEQGQFTSEPRRSGVAMGADVVPGPNAGRVAVIDQAIAELEALGPVARYEPLRRIRQAYDGPAKAVYSPAMTADYLKAQGGKLGAADVTGVLRDTLAKADPQTAAANAAYHIYRTADDVLEATREVERTRPRVGRQIMARMTGVLMGGQAAGTTGAVAGYLGGPLLDQALASGATTQLKTAAALQRLADVIRGGDVEQVAVLTTRLQRELQAAGRATRTTPIQIHEAAQTATKTAERPEDRPPALAQR